MACLIESITTSGSIPLSEQTWFNADANSVLACIAILISKKWDLPTSPFYLKCRQILAKWASLVNNNRADYFKFLSKNSTDLAMVRPNAEPERLWSAPSYL